ncbi:hypothetical protein CLU93_0001, partial [Janthinobacterium sp. 35]
MDGFAYGDAAGAGQQRVGRGGRHGIAVILRNILNL